MSDTSISQDTIDQGVALTRDPEVLEAIAHPSVTTVFNAVQDPAVQAAFATGTEVVKETRTGWKTTEFWVTVASLIGVNASGLVLTLPDKWQAAASGAIAVGYALSRGLAKKGVADIEPAPVVIAPASEIVQR